MSNAAPDAFSSFSMSCALIIPGMSAECSMPGISSGTFSPHAASKRDMVSISGSCAPLIFVARSFTSVEDAQVGARSAISTAWR